MFLERCLCWWQVSQAPGLLCEQILSAIIYIHDVTCAVVEQHHEPFQYRHSCVTDVRMHEVKLFKCLSSLRKNLPHFPCSLFANTTKCRKLMHGTCTIIARILHILQVGFSWVSCMQYTSIYISDIPLLRTSIYHAVIPLCYLYTIPLLPLYHAVISLTNDTSATSLPVIYIPVIPLYQRYLYTSNTSAIPTCIYISVIPLVQRYITGIEVSLIYRGITGRYHCMVYMQQRYHWYIEVYCMHGTQLKPTCKMCKILAIFRASIFCILWY